MNIPQEIINRYDHRLINGSYIFAEGHRFNRSYCLMLEKHNGSYLLWFNNGVINTTTGGFNSTQRVVEGLFRNNKIVLEEMTSNTITISVGNKTYKMLLG